jgi:hypothetical protein
MLTAVRYLVRAEIQANKTEEQAVADKPSLGQRRNDRHTRPPGPGGD